VSRVYSVAAVPYLQNVPNVMLFRPRNVMYFNISAFRSKHAVHNMAVFCSTLISCLPGLSLRYCLNYSEMVPVVPIITGITVAFTSHMR